MDGKKLIEAAKLISENCATFDASCDGCVFHRKDRCTFENIHGRLLMPEDWDLTKPRRWTDKDIALAKALKAFGVYKVGRVSNGGIRAYTVGATGGCGVPKGAFAALKQGEEASLNEILEEGETG